MWLAASTWGPDSVEVEVEEVEEEAGMAALVEGLCEGMEAPQAGARELPARLAEVVVAVVVVVVAEEEGEVRGLTPTSASAKKAWAWVLTVAVGVAHPEEEEAVKAAQQGVALLALVR